MPRPHSGQATLLMLAFLGSMVVAFLLVFNTGQLVNDKIRLTNAADAAAYSAALSEARSLNYQAYLNRAIVANEVAIAQLVSLRSWSDYIDTVTTNADRITRYIPPLAAPMRTLEQGWDQVDRLLDSTLPPLEAGLSQWNTRVLSAAQSIAHQQTLPAAADLVEQIVQANEPRARVSGATRVLQVRNAQTWQHRYTARLQRGGRDLANFTRLLMDSRDGFSRSRRSDLPVQVPLVSLPRRGGTDLIGQYSWRGLDTLSLHIDLLLDNVEIPLGWGSAEQRRQAIRTRGEHGGSLRRNPRASRLGLASLDPRQSYQGVPEIRELLDQASRGERTLVYSVALELPAESINTADRILMPGGMATLEGRNQSVSPNLSGNALHAISSAGVYFQRPEERHDARQESPSLFNPYWQARLVPTSATERQLAAPFRGLQIDPFAVLP